MVADGASAEMNSVESKLWALGPCSYQLLPQSGRARMEGELLIANQFSYPMESRGLNWDASTQNKP